MISDEQVSNVNADSMCDISDCEPDEFTVDNQWINFQLENFYQIKWMQSSKARKLTLENWNTYRKVVKSSEQWKRNLFAMNLNGDYCQKTGKTYA